MVAMTPEEAYCAFAYEAICQDGTVMAEEHDALIAHLEADPIVTGHPADVLRAVNRHARDLGEDLLREAARALPDDMRSATFATAARLALADHDMAPSESHFLHIARDALGMDAELAEALVSAAREP